MFIVQLLVIQLIFFAGLVFVLRKLMGKNATTTTAHLQGLSQDYLKRQEELKKRLEEAEKSYQTQLAKAQEEAQQIKLQASKEADGTRLQVVEQSRKEAEKIVQQAVQTREAQQQDLAQAVEARALERACELVEEAMPRHLRESAHGQWLDQLIANELPAPGKLEIREAITEVRVASAFPLTAGQRKLLQEKLNALAGNPVALKELIEPKIVAGLRITIGHLVLDGTLSSKIREAARHGDNGHANAKPA